MNGFSRANRNDVMVALLNSQAGAAPRALIALLNSRDAPLLTYWRAIWFGHRRLFDIDSDRHVLSLWQGQWYHLRTLKGGAA